VKADVVDRGARLRAIRSTDHSIGRWPEEAGIGGSVVSGAVIAIKYGRTRVLLTRSVEMRTIRSATTLRCFLRLYRSRYQLRRPF
jgi:hypothetical protein